MSQQQVSKFSGMFNLIVKLKWIIPIVALVLAILSVVIAMERRKTLLRLAIGVALFTLLILAGLSLGRITFLNQAGGGGFNTEAAGAVWDTVLRFLKTDLRWTLLVSCWSPSVRGWPGRAATPCGSARRAPRVAAGWAPRPTRLVGDRAGRGRSRSGCAARAAGSSSTSTACASSGSIVAGLFLVFGGNLTGWSLLVILIVLAVYLGLLQLVAAWARNVSGAGSGAGADPGSDPGPTVTSGAPAAHESRHGRTKGNLRHRRSRFRPHKWLHRPATVLILMGRLSGPRNLKGMSLRWRVGLVAIIAAAVLGGFMPHGAPVRRREARPSRSCGSSKPRFPRR